MIMLDGNGNSESMPTIESPRDDSPANDTPAIKKSAPKQEEEISVEDLPF